MITNLKEVNENLRRLREALPIAETFYSIQGEGPTMGKPSIFLRLSHCNLTCPGWGPPGSPQGCDTTAVWSKVWKRLTAEEIIQYWEEKKWLDRFHDFYPENLIITGGEPLLWQDRIAVFLDIFSQSDYTAFVEIETNGTIYPHKLLDSQVDQWNVSPKLKSSGNPDNKRYRPEVLHYFSGDARAIFKFVIQDTVSDPLEINQDYLEKFGIDPQRVWLMPEAATRERLIDRSLTVAEVCKQYGFNFSPRLQLLIWNQATGV